MTLLGKLKILVISMAVLIVILIAFVLFVPSGGDGVSRDKLYVVTTFFPLYDFTRNVGGDLVEIDILFTQTPEVSSFKPSDIKKVHNADVLVINGVWLEPILDELIEASDNDDLLIIDTSTTIIKINNDPHIWLNPENAISQVSNIRDGLAGIDPKNIGTYELQSKAYMNSLASLHREIESASKNFTSRDVITFHPAFTYFFEKYNLRQVATFEKFPGQEPSPSDLANIIDTVQRLGITAVFAEPQFSPKVVNVLAQDLGIEVKTLNPIESGNLETDTYIDLMRQNLRELQDVLQ